jgi:hypothetical protein
VFAGGSALVLAALAWRQPVIRTIRVLPRLAEDALTADIA